MGSHRDAVDIAAGVHAFVFGESASYNPLSGDSVSVDDAVLYKVRTERRDTNVGVVAEFEARDLAVEMTTLADPAIGATFTIDSERWVVTKRMASGSRWMLTLEKIEINEINRKNYRRPLR